MLKAVTIAAGIAFPYARPAIQTTRRARRSRHAPAPRDGGAPETVYAITDLGPHQFPPEELAG